MKQKKEMFVVFKRNSWCLGSSIPNAEFDLEICARPDVCCEKVCSWESISSRTICNLFFFKFVFHLSEHAKSKKLTRRLKRMLIFLDKN